MELRITMKGLEKTIQATRMLEGDMSGKEIMPAVKLGAGLLRNQGKVNAPYVTGYLRRSIHIGGEPADLPPGATDIGGQEVTATTAKVEVGTNLIYAPRVEFGFTGKDSLGRVYNQPPNPYLRGAFEQKKEEVVKEIADMVGILVKKWGSR